MKDYEGRLCKKKNAGCESIEEEMVSYLSRQQKMGDKVPTLKAGTLTVGRKNRTARQCSIQSKKVLRTRPPGFSERTGLLSGKAQLEEVSNIRWMH
jgi:hypothetical protein